MTRGQRQALPLTPAHRKAGFRRCRRLEHLDSEGSNAGFPFGDGWFIWDLCLRGWDIPGEPGSRGAGELGCFSVTVHLRASDQSRALPGSPASFELSSDHPATSLGIQAGWTPIPGGCRVKSGTPLPSPTMSAVGTLWTSP